MCVRVPPGGDPCSEARYLGLAAIILWVDEVSAEFASQAISLGVRGLLRRSLPIAMQARCLDRVAAGELWVEKTLSNKLLSTKRIA